MDKKTRKLLVMNVALHPQTDADRLHVNQGGGKGWMSVEDVVKVEHSLLELF